jgi:hypothetical protein
LLLLLLPPLLLYFWWSMLATPSNHAVFTLMRSMHAAV